MRVQVIADSRGPNGKRIITFKGLYPRFIHSEHLRHRTQSFSVASSRAIPAAKLLEQVKEQPAMPILWPKQHKGMQGAEVFTDRDEIYWYEEQWLHARNAMVEASEELSEGTSLSEDGLSKQLTNRLLEPWVETQCVYTATEWDGFFKLRCPHVVRSGSKTADGKVEVTWGKEIDLTFPAEYNIQQLALLTKEAMESSEPKQLGAGEWHLPFIEAEDRDYAREDGNILVKLSAARCAMTSYNRNSGKSVDSELELASRLVTGAHWSPFEHQAQAVDSESFLEQGSVRVHKIPDGMQMRVSNTNTVSFWSRNLQGWVQARALLETNNLGGLI